MKHFKILFISCILILLSFVIIQYYVNNQIQDYKIEIKTDNINYDNILTKEYWVTIIEDKKYDELYGLSADLFDTMKIEDGYLIIDGKGISFEDANRFLRALLNNGLSSSSEGWTENYVTIKFNTISPFVTVAICIIEIVVLITMYLLITKAKIQIFTKEYWKNSRNEIKSVRKLCLMTIIFTMQVVAGIISLPSGFGNLGIGLSYLFQAINCMLFGPVNGLLLGALGDTIGFMIDPSPYGFFPGYTLNAMLSCMMYGLCFYKTRVTFTKVFISRLFINFFVNVLLGGIWWGIVAGYNQAQTINYILIMQIPKNVIYLIPQSILLFYVLKCCVKLFYKFGYIEEYQTNITII